MKHLYTLFILAALALTASAQQPSQWATEMLEAKHSFIIEQVQLTPAQQQQFMPLYEAMEKEIYQTNRDARTIATSVEKKASPTDADYMQAAEALSRAKVREGEIEEKYFAQFAKILSKRQLYLLKRAENQFTREMLRGRKP